MVAVPVSNPSWRPRMNIHKNARTTPYSRLLMARRVAAGDDRESRGRVLREPADGAEMRPALANGRRERANTSCFVRPKGPLLRPNLLSPMTAAAGRAKDRRRRPTIAGAQR